MKTITKLEAMAKILAKGNNRIFSVTFTKKDGSTRVMNCRKSASKGINGNGAKYDALEKALLPVYDMAKGWRTINFKTIQSVSIKGNKYRVI